MLVIAIDTSTPVITAGVVRVKRPDELVAEALAAEQANVSREDAAPTVRGDAGAGLAGPPYAVLAERSRIDAFGHAEYVMPLLGAALADAGHTVADLCAVVVGVGPGPFTGLRVGMATAAALGDARGLPVYGVPSHDAMARAALGAGDFLVATDARRREVYLSAYRASGVRAHGPVVVRPADAAEMVAAQHLSPEWITGAGATLVSEGLRLPVRDAAEPLSGGLVGCAARDLLTGAVPGPLTPLYLRRPDAAEPHGPKPVFPADSPGTASS